MTRKELAQGIYRINKQRGLAGKISEAEYVRRLLKGVGAMKPQSKQELQSWYDRLMEEFAA